MSKLRMQGQRLNSLPCGKGHERLLRRWRKSDRRDSANRHPTWDAPASSGQRDAGSTVKGGGNKIEPDLATLPRHCEMLVDPVEAPSLQRRNPERNNATSAPDVARDFR